MARYKNFSILPLSIEDESLYRDCYTNKDWVSNYTSSSIDISGAFSNLIVESPFVKRFVVKDKINTLGFFNVIRKGKESDKCCVLSGGIHPNKIDTGIGVILTVITVDFTLNVLGYNKVINKTLERNKRNIKLLKALGFRQEGYMIEDEYDENIEEFVNVYQFAYLKKDFPKSLSKRILKKYEKK